MAGTLGFPREWRKCGDREVWASRSAAPPDEAEEMDGWMALYRLQSSKLLPKDEMYTPPIVLKVIDHRPFGRKPVVGQCTISTLEQFRCDPYVVTAEGAMSSKMALLAAAPFKDVAINMGDETRPLLEAQFMYSMSAAVNKMASPTSYVVCIISYCSFLIHVWAPMILKEDALQSHCQQSKKLLNIDEINNTIDDRDHYLPNTINPVFGRMFEMTCFLPQDKDLRISVYDYDLLTRDEKVGETVIDLENRFLSRYNSYCGIPQTYCISGINQWRDQLKPSQILENLARMKGLSKPRSEDNGTSMMFNGKEYTLAEFEGTKEIHQHLGPPSERLCLHVLRTQGVVPEHVETRTLYSSFQPNLSQGRLQMWVDVFPKSIGIPGPPFDITPRKPKKFFLRAVIWNTTDVTLDETSITGENMSDIYVKGWMPGMEENKQKTDVHYRSLDGDGNFNWRFVFEFEYLPAEQLCLVSKKEHFWSLDNTEFRIPPKLLVQIWDNDKFSLDDYLGTLELDLRNLVSPAKNPDKCSLDMMDVLDINATNKKEHQGWWPCSIEQDGKRVVGVRKVEMTLEIVSETEADERPAGKGRDEPNMNPKLDPPKRPETSFFWFTNPCKTMKFIVWRRFKWVFIGLIILIIVLLFVAILLYSLPNYISMKIVKPFQ
ncbi:hypothetical protein WMY93_011079 [Mugilogobius chulae]|uniref:C2 domain-containing protein n=1 Tax=Mugilogobius chulae TaxID=88201 RepID=A0AAW0PAF5_9GOBI